MIDEVLVVWVPAGAIVAAAMITGIAAIVAAHINRRDQGK